MELVLESADSIPPEAISPEDALLAAWAGRQDRVALNELFTRCRPQAYALAVRICGRNCAEDAVQEGFLGAMRGARGWRGRQAMAWLLAAVANAARNQVRGEVRRTQREAIVPPAPSSHEPDEDADLGEVVRGALAELPEHQRSALELRYLAGLDLQATAAALGRPYKTVHGQVERGLERLREVLGRRGYATLGCAAIAMALASGAPAAEPAGLEEAVSRLAFAGPAPAPAWSRRLAAGLVLVLAVAAGFAGWLHLADPRPAQALAADPPPAPVAEVGILDLRVEVRFVHDRIDEALQALARAMPAGRPLAYAILEPLEKGVVLAEPLGGVVWDPPGPVRVREALDAIAAQAGLAWSRPQDAVVLYRPVADAVAQVREALPLLAQQVSVLPQAQQDQADLSSCKAFWRKVWYDAPEPAGSPMAVLRRCGRTPETQALILAWVLDPAHQSAGSLAAQLAMPGPLAADDDASPVAISPHRLSPIEALTTPELGVAAVACLRALATRPQGPDRALCQAVLAARIAAVTRTPGAGDAIFALVGRGPAAEPAADLSWRSALALSLALAGDPRAQPLLESLLQRAGPGDQDMLCAAFGRSGAYEVLAARDRLDALGWDRGAASLARLLQQPITSSAQAARVGVALLRRGAGTLPPGLARYGEIEAIAVAMARCGGASMAGVLLELAGKDDLGIGSPMGDALALIEDPQVLPVLAGALASPMPGRAQAAATALANSRLPGATGLLRRALADLPAEDPRAQAWWRAALSGRDDALAQAALAEVRQRGDRGTLILFGLEHARTAAAITGGWALVGELEAPLAQRLLALRQLPRMVATDLRADTINALLQPAGGPVELRSAALLQAGAAELPACRAAVLAALQHDPSGWVRASAVFAASAESLFDPGTQRLQAIRLREDPSPQVRAYAAIFQLDPAVLTQALASERSPRVREAIALTLSHQLIQEDAAAARGAAQAVAQRLAAAERDPAARHALQALAEGRVEPAFGVDTEGTVAGGAGQDQPRNEIRYEIHGKDGQTWTRRIFEPTRPADDNADPVLPFADG